MIDATNWAILHALQENARATYAEIGKEVGLTAPAVAERIRKMEEANIITGYRAEVNLSQVGLPIIAFIQFAQSKDRKDRFIDMVRTLPDIVECYTVTGKDCFFMKAAVPSIVRLEELLKCLAAYGHTTTSIVLATPVPARIVDRR